MSFNGLGMDLGAGAQGASAGLFEERYLRSVGYRFVLPRVGLRYPRDIKIYFDRLRYASITCSDGVRADTQSCRRVGDKRRDAFASGGVQLTLNGRLCVGMVFLTKACRARAPLRSDQRGDQVAKRRVPQP